MQANPHLSIVIPTFNRADLLDYCLEVHIPLARAHNVQLFIFDNASEDATEEVVNRRKKEYPFIQYHCNETNVGPDNNFEIALKCPKTRYVWLLGDTYRIPSEGINYVLNLILTSGQKYDLVVFNLAGRIEDVETRDFTDNNNLLSSLGALMTCLSCLIYSKDLISNSNFTKYKDTSFIQTGVIFEAIAKQTFRIHWAQSMSISGLDSSTVKKDSWWMTPDVFNIAGTKWVNFVFLLPNSYDLESKLKCIMDFTKVSGVFSLKHLLLIRSANILNYKTYKEYKHLFSVITKYPKILILFLSLLPKVLPRLLKQIQNSYRRIKIFICYRGISAGVLSIMFGRR